MLNLMRKHASSWLIKVVLFAIVVVFVFWGVGTMRSSKGTEVADVNGEVISYDAYRQTYNRFMENYRRAYGSRFDDNLMQMLSPHKKAINFLVDRKLIIQEAERLNINVAKEELREAIRSIPAFQNNGVFDYERYTLILAQSGSSAEQFEADHAQSLVIDKIRNIVTGGIAVTDEEAKEWYNWSNAKVSLTYALFPPDRYEDVQPTEEQIRAFFNDHKDNYRTEPKIKARFIHFNLDDYKAGVEISEESVKEYYEGHPAEFKTDKRVKARHVLFKVDAGADEKTIESKKAEANKVYELAKAGEDFSELAKKYSEGPTKDNGGDLGWFTRNRMVKPFADKAFSMASGDISEPVRSDFGWHVIKLEQIEEATTQNLEEAEKGIKIKLAAEKAKEEALKKAEALYDSVYDGDDLTQAGKAHQMSVQETAFFTPAGPSEKEIVQRQKFAQTAFSLEKMAISEIQELGNAYYIIQVIDRQEAQIPEFDKVAERVKADSLKDQQKERAKADAEAFLADVQKGKSFADAGAQYNVTPMETVLFERNGVIPEIGNELQINQAAFELSADKPLAEKVLQGRKGLYVIYLKDRQGPDSADQGFAKEKEGIVSRLTTQKQEATFDNWLADIKSRGAVDIKWELIQP